MRGVSRGPALAGVSFRIARFLVGLRWVSLLIGLISFGVAYPYSQQLEFDRSVASLFAPSDPSYQAYRQLRNTFGGNSVVILVYKDNQLASEAGIDRNRVIANLVKQVEGVTGVLSPAQLNNAIKKFQPISLFGKGPNLFRPGDAVAEGFDQLFAGYTHSRDHSRAAVVAMLEPEYSPETILALKRLAQSLHLKVVAEDSRQPMVEDVVIVGEPVLIHDGFSLIERDGTRLAVWTITLLSLVVLVSLADFRFVLLSVILISWSVVVTKATMVILSVKLSLVSTILTAIVTVIAVTAVLHMGVRFRTAVARGWDPPRAAIATFGLLWLPILGTCLTDAAGFAALYASQILPIRQFGLMIALAAFAVCVAIGLFGPVVLMFPGFQLLTSLGNYQRRMSVTLRRCCVRIAHGAIAHRKGCLVLALSVTAFASIGVGRAETDTSFLNNFRSGSEIVAAYRQVETDFGGAGVWDVILDAPTEMNEDYLSLVRELEQALRSIEIHGQRLTKVLSLADAEQIAARSPISGVFSSSSRLSAIYLAMPVFFRALLTDANDGDRKIRIMIRSREQLDAETKTALIEAVEATVDDFVHRKAWVKSIKGTTDSDARESSRVSGTVTGYYVIMARLINQLVADQWRCFLMSGLLVLGLLWGATRSLRLALAALFPNLLPIFLVLAVLGFGGSKINMGAAMIAAVSVGLSIDGSVHFLAGYIRARRRGHQPNHSARHAAGNMGVPILLATLALMIGFGVMATSEFVPTATFGVLVASTLALGTAVNLTLLPSLVSWTDCGKQAP